jgi:glycerol-3-phosphate dehydrogenase (NAD(P)+)
MKFVIVGAGAWGTAFAVHLARGDQPVVLVPRRLEQAERLATTRQDADYLPGIKLPEGVRVEHDLGNAMTDADVVLLACPSHALRETCERVRASLSNVNGQTRWVVSLAKGLELGTHLRPSEVIAATLQQTHAGSLTGPTNAREVALGLPAAMVLGGPTQGTIKEVQRALSGPTLRVYTCDDLPGIEFGGSLKNIYAIAAGCCDGLKLGDNSKAALLTRALAEMVRVGTALGARTETFYGLSGFGDLVVTCHGGWSRNREFGEQIGSGESVSGLLENRKSVVEGYKTTKAFWELCAEKKIDAPILQETHAILYEGKAPAAALSSLMTRGLKCE